MTECALPSSRTRKPHSHVLECLLVPLPKNLASHSPRKIKALKLLNPKSLTSLTTRTRIVMRPSPPTSTLDTCSIERFNSGRCVITTRSRNFNQLRPNFSLFTHRPLWPRASKINYHFRASNHKTDDNCFHFLNLPGEMRNIVYEMVFPQEVILGPHTTVRKELGLLLAAYLSSNSPGVFRLLA